MAAQVFVLTYLQLAALLFGLKHFPESLPKRWETISIYVGLCSQTFASSSSDCSSHTSAISIQVIEGEETTRKKSKVFFSATPKQCKQVAGVIQLTNYYASVCHTTELFYQPLLSNPDISSPLKPIILTPPIFECCGTHLSLRNRPSFPLVYTLSGTYVAAAYHGQCHLCGTTYHNSYYEKKDDNNITKQLLFVMLLAIFKLLHRVLLR